VLSLFLDRFSGFNYLFIYSEYTCVNIKLSLLYLNARSDWNQQYKYTLINIYEIMEPSPCSDITTSIMSSFVLPLYNLFLWLCFVHSILIQKCMYINITAWEIVFSKHTRCSHVCRHDLVCFSDIPHIPI